MSYQSQNDFRDYDRGRRSADPLIADLRVALATAERERDEARKLLQRASWDEPNPVLVAQPIEYPTVDDVREAVAKRTRSCYDEVSKRGHIGAAEWIRRAYPEVFAMPAKAMGRENGGLCACAFDWTEGGVACKQCGLPRQEAPVVEWANLNYPATETPMTPATMPTDEHVNAARECLDAPDAYWVAAEYDRVVNNIACLLARREAAAVEAITAEAARLEGERDEWRAKYDRACLATVRAVEAARPAIERAARIGALEEVWSEVEKRRVSYAGGNEYSACGANNDKAVATEAIGWWIAHHFKEAPNG